MNPIVKLAFAARIIPPGYALLETIGRRSGKRRRTPVGYARKGDTVWIVAEHGRRAAYVRNIEANPRVRLKLGGRWRGGTADVLPDDDAEARLTQVGTSLSRAAVRVMRTQLVTVQIELDR